MIMGHVTAARVATIDGLERRARSARVPQCTGCDARLAAAMRDSLAEQIRMHALRSHGEVARRSSSGSTPLPRRRHTSDGASSGRSCRCRWGLPAPIPTWSGRIGAGFLPISGGRSDRPAAASRPRPHPDRALAGLGDEALRRGRRRLARRGDQPVRDPRPGTRSGRHPSRSGRLGAAHPRRRWPNLGKPAAGGRPGRPRARAGAHPRLAQRAARGNAKCCSCLPATCRTRRSRSLWALATRP